MGEVLVFDIAIKHRQSIKELEATKENVRILLEREIEYIDRYIQEHKQKILELTQPGFKFIDEN